MRAQRWRDTAGGELDVELDVDLILVQTPEVQLRLAPSHVYVHGELLGVFEDGDKALMLVVSRSRDRWRPRRNMLMSEMALNGGKILRHHICRDRWDRRSRKISVNCVKF